MIRKAGGYITRFPMTQAMKQTMHEPEVKVVTSSQDNIVVCDGWNLKIRGGQPHNKLQQLLVCIVTVTQQL